MLVHLVEQIRKFGPAHWTMRFEGKNALPKSKKFFNFKNIPFSVSEVYQLSQSYALWNGDGSPRLQWGDTTEQKLGRPIKLTEAFVEAGLENRFVGEIGHTVTSANVENVQVKLSDVMIVGDRRDAPVFVKVLEIACREKSVFFTCTLLCVLEFSAKLNAFVTRETSHQKVFAAESFRFPWPVYVYITEQGLCCIPRCLDFCPNSS